MILYLTYWFPKRYRGRVTAGFMTAIPIASFIAAPLSGFLLELAWLRPEELAVDVHPGGHPVGPARHRRPPLPDRSSCAGQVAHATSSAQWLADEMEAERLAAAHATGGHDHSLGEVLRSLLSWNVLSLALIYFGLTTGLYGIELWLPQIVKGFGLSNIEVGLRRGHPLRRRHRHDDAVGQLLRPLGRDALGNRLSHVAMATAWGASAWASPPP